MKILVIGDVIGKPGRDALRDILPGLKQEYKIDFTIINGENTAGGIGITPATAQDLISAGADVITTGNHVWKHRDIATVMEEESLPVIRPLNYPPGVPGQGYVLKDKVLVVNLMGRTFMYDIDCPFRSIDALLSKLNFKPSAIIVDFHAEATSEKMALGFYLDGRVSAVLGTHTHVATCDTRLLPKNTAYVSDIGMVGPIDSIIGDEPDSVIQRFLTGIPGRLSVAQGRVMLNAVVVTVNTKTGLSTGIERIYREIS
ncbi:TIGR00282 family metallophosphoesterase [Dehalococcoides mccartyi]|uniref:TIGR00282 family metallophosphoesterase n=1 Tax=Dehalococcoides mccartyi TaxID=61435 RepID=UPI0003C823BA|nr:TIGR00282 family metallophosphoesterase [Dehalococcoides mccartyi]AHB14272.1 metallophosphoesterase [Dehalococcoides mccartyi GY50]